MIFPDRLQLRGRTLVARIPADQLGGLPTAGWGYSVHVSGATWERNLKVVDRLTGSFEADAFTMPILSLREAWTFGGAPPGDAFPRVVDVLLPAGVDQREVLGSYRTAGGAWAQVPFVYAQPPGPAPAPLPSPDAAPGRAPRRPPSRWSTSPAPWSPWPGRSRSSQPMQLGQVLGPKGEPVARLVVVQLLEKGAVASVVDGAGQVTAGARVRFDPPATAPRPPAPHRPLRPSGHPARPRPGACAKAVYPLTLPAVRPPTRYFCR